MATQSSVKVADDTTGTLRDVDTVTMPSNFRRQVYVVGDADTDAAYAKVRSTEPAQTDLGLVVRPVSSGSDLAHRLLTNSNNAVSVRGFAGRLMGLHAWNNSSTVFFVKVYDKVGIPNPATDTVALKFVMGVQAGTYRDVTFGARGAAFTNGIGIAVVTGISDTDNTSVVVNAGTVSVESSL